MADTLTRLADATGEVRPESVLSETLLFLGWSPEPARIEQAARRVVADNPVLRTQFRVDATIGPVQRITDGSDGAIAELVDCSTATAEEFSAVVATLSARQNSTLFDLMSGCLLRVVVIPGPERRTALIITVDHTVLDGFAFNELLGQFSAAYTAGAVSPRSGPAVDLVAYAETEAALLDGTAGARLRAAWRARLPRGFPELRLNVNTPWTELSREGRVYQRTIAGDLCAAFREQASALRVTPFMLAVAQLLNAMRPAVLDDELSFVTSLPGRIPGAPAALMGNLINVLPVTLEAATTVTGLAHAVRAGLAWTLVHQALPLSQVMAEVDPGAPTAADKRRQIFLVGQRRQDVVLDGVTGRTQTGHFTEAWYDMALWITDSGAGLELYAIYRPEVVAPAQAEGWLGRIGPTGQET